MVQSDRAALRPELSVGELAKRSGVPVSTIHFYESKGLINSWRNDAGHRRYARGVLRRVAVIRIAQRVGIPLGDIASALETLPAGRTPTVRDWNKLSAQWRADLDRRILGLTQLRDQLASCIGCGCLSVTDCPLRNPSDRLGKQGSGARLLKPV